MCGLLKVAIGGYLLIGLIVAALVLSFCTPKGASALVALTIMAISVVMAVVSRRVLRTVTHAPPRRRRMSQSTHYGGMSWRSLEDQPLRMDTTYATDEPEAEWPRVRWWALMGALVALGYLLLVAFVNFHEPVAPPVPGVFPQAQR